MKKLKTYYSTKLPTQLKKYNADNISISATEKKAINRIRENEEYTLYEVTFKPTKRITKTLHTIIKEVKIKK